MEQSNAKWLEFELTKPDIKQFEKTELLSTRNDKISDEIIEWYESHIRPNNDITADVSEYFRKKIDALKKHKH